jgi:protein SCO1
MRIHLLCSALLLAPLAAFADEPSLHDFSSTFVDQDGRRVTLAKLAKGHPVMLTMFYGTCPAACPLLVSRMKRIERELPEAVRRDLRVILVSFDPARDTVESLKRLQRAHGVDTTRWSLLRIDDEEAIRELAATLGVKYRFLKGGAINHSSVISYADPRGVIRARTGSLEEPDETILAAAQEAVARK